MKPFQGVTQPASSRDALLHAAGGLLDWEQLRVLLSEALDVVPRDAADRWEHVAALVNGRCRKSRPRTSAEFERAFRTIASLEIAGASRLHDDSKAGRGVWLRLLYRTMQDTFGLRQRFLNLGYEGQLVPRPFALRAEDEPERSYIQLYDRLIGDTPLEGRILEVGCGWGGGCGYVAKYFAPRLMVGLDLVEGNIAACRAEPPLERPTFLVGDAMELPFASASFDVVINLQSSHNYASFSRFVSEVWRILAGGGTFLLADLRPTQAAWESVRDTLATAGFESVETDDVTPGVLAAMTRQAAAKSTLLDKLEEAGREEDRASLAEVMLCPGSENHERLQRGGARFLAFRLRKPS